jgi:hypothetical protein
MKVAISYLTKDRPDLTEQTGPRMPFDHAQVFSIDGSVTKEGRMAVDLAMRLFGDGGVPPRFWNVGGGADAAIVFALTKMLAHRANYTHVGLCENDVLLHDGWFDKTMALFERGKADGLEVGAVSPRCYADRILIQRDGYAVMHNLGAGIVLFTREAAEIILANYRTGWWSDNRSIFAQLSGIDIGRYGAFRGNQQWTTADWHFDAALAQHGLASLALSPSAVEMIGQEPSLEEQGLVLMRQPVEERRDDEAFARFSSSLISIAMGWREHKAIQPIHQYAGIRTYFPHQLSDAAFEGEWRLKWSQGFGPFAWRASEDGCRLQLPLFGPVTFLVSGGAKGAKVSITDIESGYEIKPDIPAGEHQIAQIQMPAGMSYREIVMTCSEGAVFYGVQTTEPQPVTNQKFDYHSLPPV